jgi:predicted transcriptional regulator
MTKTLTEQWKDGKLTFGKMYWCCDKEKNIAKLVNINRKFFEWDIATDVTKDVKEVLAPVPNYEEFQLLQEQLDIVTEQRNDIHIDNQVLQKQLNEANRIIKKLYKESGNPIGLYYLEKWGVK